MHILHAIAAGLGCENIGQNLFWYPASIVSHLKNKSIFPVSYTHLDVYKRQKISCTAYELLPKRKPGRGRPAKKGAAAKLRELIATATGQFRETTETLYGRKETVRYYSTDLLWGQRPVSYTHLISPILAEKFKRPR